MIVARFKQEAGLGNTALALLAGAWANNGKGVVLIAAPQGPETWLRTPDQRPNNETKAARFTVRPTIDVTRVLQGRINVAPFQRGVTVAHLLCELTARAFPNSAGDAA